jgi:hypothetical protein
MSHRETRIVINSWSQLWRPALRVLGLLHLKQRTLVPELGDADDVQPAPPRRARVVRSPAGSARCHGSGAVRHFNGFLANLPIIATSLTYWIVARPQATGEQREELSVRCSCRRATRRG